MFINSLHFFVVSFTLKSKLSPTHLISIYKQMTQTVSGKFLIRVSLFTFYPLTNIFLFALKVRCSTDSKDKKWSEMNVNCKFPHFQEIMTDQRTVQPTDGHAGHRENYTSKSIHNCHSIFLQTNL